MPRFFYQQQSMTDPVTVTIDGDLFKVAKQAFLERSRLLELQDQEFVNHAMRYICRNAHHEGQLRALRMTGKIPVLTTDEEISAIAEQIRKLQLRTIRRYGTTSVPSREAFGFHAMVARSGRKENRGFSSPGLYQALLLGCSECADHFGTIVCYIKASNYNFGNTVCACIMEIGTP